MNPTKDRIGSIYIHIPFCKERCLYCDFYSNKTGNLQSRIASYIEAIEKDYFSYRSSIGTIGTIYIGGGTPSAIPSDSLHNLLKFLQENLLMNSGCEFTIEANPESVSSEFLKVIREYNAINRISIGVQSLDDRILSALGRIHNRADVLKALENIYENGIENINVDFIIGVTDDTEKFITDIRTLIDNFPINHLSAYILTVNRNRGRLRKFLKIEEETITNQYIQLHNLLHKYGFTHYEVSNYARSGYESRHNLNYWQNGLYVGLGASASGYIVSGEGKRIRYKNISDYDKYIHGINHNEKLYDEYEVIDEKKFINETIMLGMRTIGGIDIGLMKERMSKKEFEVFITKAEALNKDGYLQMDQHTISPTLKGFLFNNFIIRELFI